MNKVENKQKELIREGEITQKDFTEKYGAKRGAIDRAGISGKVRRRKVNHFVFYNLEDLRKHFKV